MSMCPTISRSFSLWLSFLFRFLLLCFPLKTIVYNLCGAVQIISTWSNKTRRRQKKTQRWIPAPQTDLLCTHTHFSSFFLCYLCYWWNIQNTRLYFIQLIAMPVLRLATAYNIIIENQCDYPFFPGSSYRFSPQLQVFGILILKKPTKELNINGFLDI